MLPARTKSTLPPTQWARPAAQSRIAAWKTSVPTTFFGERRKTAISRIAITVPEPAEVIPITKPVVAPITTAAILWRRLTLEVVALFDQVAEDQRPRQGDDPDHQQGAAEHRVDEFESRRSSPTLLLQRPRPAPTPAIAAGTLPTASQIDQAPC